MASAIWAVMVGVGSLHASGVQFDATKVMGHESCAECHASETAAWQKTPHHATWDTLHTKDSAKTIAEKMEVRSVKRGDLCLNCHYTRKDDGSGVKPVSGVSCESCHAPAAGWIKIHNDYGGPDVKKEQESPAHKIERMKKAMEGGMLPPDNIYLVAQNCYNCHTVPNEKLVNVGGHKAGSEGFELVAWSQGMVRHNYHRTGGKTNEASKPERLRVMYVVGLMVEVEYSLRGLAPATERATYAVTMAKRAKAAMDKLEALHAKAPIAEVAAALEAAKAAGLKLNNAEALNAAAEKVAAAAKALAASADGSKLAAVDELLPKPDQYKGAASP
jgi:hypothetical protein